MPGRITNPYVWRTPRWQGHDPRIGEVRSSGTPLRTWTGGSARDRLARNWAARAQEVSFVRKANREVSWVVPGAREVDSRRIKLSFPQSAQGFFVSGSPSVDARVELDIPTGITEENAGSAQADLCFRHQGEKRGLEIWTAQAPLTQGPFERIHLELTIDPASKSIKYLKAGLQGTEHSAETHGSSFPIKLTER